MQTAIRALIACLALLLVSANARAAPQANAGRLDLGAWQFERDGPVSLDGQWEFAANRLLGGTDPWPADATFLRAPGPWNSPRHFGYGAGTYRLHVDCSAREPLGLIVPFQHSAAAVFVNGRRVAAHGVPGLTRATQDARIEEEFAPLDGIDCPLDIRVQVSNHDMYLGGMLRGLVLGEREQLRRARETLISESIAIVAIVGVLGFWSLVLWARRPHDATGLLFGLFCINLAFVIGMYYEHTLATYLPLRRFDGQMRSMLATYYLWMTLWPLLLRSLYPRQAGRSLTLFLSSFSATGFVICVLLPLRISAHVGPFVWLLPHPVGLFVVGVLVRACMQGERGARVVLVSALLLYVLFVADLFGFRYVHGVTGTRLMPLGVLAFVLATALLLGGRIIRALQAEELRSIELRQRADLLVRTTQAGVLDWDTPSGQVRMSERYREMLGLPPVLDASELPEFESLVHPQDRERVHALLTAHLQARGSGLQRWEPMEFRMLRSDGQPVWVHAEAISLHGEDGRPLRHICTFIDISHLKATQEQLRETQSRLVAEARRAGMAQIATNVLHNVGNVLTSVNVSTHVMADRLRQSRAGRLDDVAALLEAGVADPQQFFAPTAKGRLLPGYVRELARALASERDGLLAEIGRLAASVEHIKNVVAVQQSYAGTRGVLERERLDVLAEDALRLQEAALTRHRVRVERNFERVDAMPLDRTRVIQILVNLIENAREAMDAVAGERVLRIALRRGDGCIALSVSDNGCGIAPEHLARIFSHGFTTKPNGHGFGLHSCAVAAAEMGGRVTAHSDGPGTGATFTLELRLVAQAASASRVQGESDADSLVASR